MSDATEQPKPNGNGKALQKTDPKIDTMRDLLIRAKPKFLDVLPRHLDADKIVRMALFAVTQSSYLLACTPQSILTSVMRACALGLDVGGVTGHAYLVPFKNTAQLVVGYKGYIELATRSGRVASVEARAVYQGDDFEYELGLTPILKHRPKVVDPKPENLTHAYAIARLRDGGALFEVLNRAQVEGRRLRSAAVKAGRPTPWQTDYEAMARKTPVRALASYLPQSPELAGALELDRRADEGDDTPLGFSDVIDVLPEVPVDEKPKTVDALTDKLKAQNQALNPDEPPADAATATFAKAEEGSRS